MPETQRERITNKVFEMLENSPEGLRYGELFHKLTEIFPGMPRGNLHGTLYFLRNNEQIIKPERGLFVLKRFTESTVERRAETDNHHLPTETSFYQPFADYLVQDLDECTKAIPLGGNTFGGRWGTPDVFGILILVRNRTIDLFSEFWYYKVVPFFR